MIFILLLVIILFPRSSRLKFKSIFFFFKESLRVFVLLFLSTTICFVPSKNKIICFVVFRKNKKVLYRTKKIAPFKSNLYMIEKSFKKNNNNNNNNNLVKKNNNNNNNNKSMSLSC